MGRLGRNQFHTDFGLCCTLVKYCKENKMLYVWCYFWEKHNILKQQCFYFFLLIFFYFFKRSLLYLIWPGKLVKYYRFWKSTKTNNCNLTYINKILKLMFKNICKKLNKIKKIELQKNSEKLLYWPDFGSLKSYDV